MTIGGASWRKMIGSSLSSVSPHSASAASALAQRCSVPGPPLTWPQRGDGLATCAGSGLTASVVVVCGAAALIPSKGSGFVHAAAHAAHRSFSPGFSGRSQS